MASGARAPADRPCPPYTNSAPFPAFPMDTTILGLGTTPLSNQPATLGVNDADGYSSTFAGMMQRKRGAPQSGWQNKDTVHSENMPSYNVSAAAGHALDQQVGAAQELLSLGSGGLPAEQSTTSGLQGDRRSLAPATGGVFSGTLQSFQ